jgi:2-polyprenyl-3-methyl-5-hydroxy-6-metoxy-1,4-benzoquinol methylase
METENYNPLSSSFIDYLNGDTSATIVEHNDSGERHEAPVSIFFRDPARWSLDRKAIELCYGRILDLGAGTGSHSLALEARGFSVCAIDSSLECVEVMRRRGVKEVRHANFFTFQSEPFDTIISMMNGFALVERLDRLPLFLDHIKELLKPGGLFLVDSEDLRTNATPRIIATINEKVRVGKYFGEVDIHLEYKGKKNSPKPHLFIDAETLTKHASKAGWHCEVVAEEGNGRYLARLTLKK